MSNLKWPVFAGQAEPFDFDPGLHLPPPPPWRRFSETPEVPQALSLTEAPRDIVFLDEDVIERISAALYLRRPVLVEGDPGTGKSSIAGALAYELKLGQALRWNINTRSTREEGLYRYDAIGRLHDLNLRPNAPALGQGVEVAAVDARDAISPYIRLGPLGTALVPSAKPRVLLVDELDKSDVDLPNDLLDVLEDGHFEIPELTRIDRTGEAAHSIGTHDGGSVEVRGGHVRCRHFPVVIMTSNGERDFPAAFMRRVIHVQLKAPGADRLKQIVLAKLGLSPDAWSSEFDAAVDRFLDLRREGQATPTDRLLQAVFLLGRPEVTGRLRDGHGFFSQQDQEDR